MVDIFMGFLAGAAATLVPLYVGVVAPRILKDLMPSLKPVLYAALSAGILVWFLVDVLGDAALLDVGQGFRVEVPQVYIHIGLIIAFAAGVLGLFLLEGSLHNQDVVSGTVENQTVSASVSVVPLSLTYAVAIVVALGIGFHALGEGYDIGALIPSATSILDMIGGVSSGVAYVLHKLLEGFVVGVFALIAGSIDLKRLGVLGLVSGIPTLLGFVVGVPDPLGGIGGSTYFFALGAAGGVYAELKIVPYFLCRGSKYSLIVAFLIGVYAMYFAGLFHAGG